MKPTTSVIFHFSAVDHVCGFSLSSAPHVTRSLSFLSGVDGLRLNALCGPAGMKTLRLRPLGEDGSDANVDVSDPISNTCISGVSFQCTPLTPPSSLVASFLLNSPNTPSSLLGSRLCRRSSARSVGAADLGAGSGDKNGDAGGRVADSGRRLSMPNSPCSARGSRDARRSLFESCEALSGCSREGAGDSWTEDGEGLESSSASASSIISLVYGKGATIVSCESLDSLLDMLDVSESLELPEEPCVGSNMYGSAKRGA